MAQAKPIRVILGKPGIDGHDTGIKVLANALKDAGMDVVYLGIRRTPEDIVEAAVEEDAQVIGLSFHSLVHRTMIPELVNLIREKGLHDALLIIGGSILDQDKEIYKAQGVAEVFGVGTPTSEVIDFIHQNVRR